MHDLDAALVDGEQALGGERVDDGAAVRVGVDLVPRESAARVGRVVARGHEPEEEPSSDRALVVVEPFVRVLGRLRDRTDDTAGRPEPVERQHRAAPAQPRLQQRVRDERQRAGLVARLVEDRLGQAGFEPQPGALRRAFDRARSSSRRIGPTRIWLSLMRSASHG